MPQTTSDGPTLAREQSDSAIALEHGFDHLGRFSVEFRQRFGEESPRETLARARRSSAA